MALRVSDILKLKGLTGLKLEAGSAGLDRYVASAGILDYEYVTSAPRLTNPLFNEGSFVISSLLFAKDDPSLLLPAVKQLAEAHGGCLMLGCEENIFTASFMVRYEIE